MRVALSLAVRQARGAWRHFVLLFLCVALGVAALVAVGSFAAALRATLGREARALTGGDVEVRAARPLPAEAEAQLAALAAQGATVLRVTELAAMLREPQRGGSLLVELKAAGPAYPLYGRLVTVPPAPWSRLLDADGLIVQQEVLDRLGVRVGDRVTLGTVSFVIRGVLEREPDRPASLVTLGPRVFVGPEALPRTGLVQTGSRVRYRVLVRLPHEQDARAVRDALARRIDDPSVRVSSYDESQPGLRRFFDQLTTYLGLVGLASLLVGGIGVASSVSTFVRRQQTTIAILKAVGADARTIALTFVLQTQSVALAASLTGAALGVALQPLLVTMLSGFVPFDLSAQIDAWTVVRGVVMGMLTALLCALWPLAEAAGVRPSLLLRRDVDAAAPPGRRPWLAAGALVAGLVTLSLWQAGSLTIGGIFLGAAVAAVVGLWALGGGLVMLARRLRRLPSLAWRHGVGALHRPGGQSGRVVVALGAGVMLLVAVALLEQRITAQIDYEQRRDAPSFFFIDVQPDQREPFVRVLGQTAGVAPALIPVVRARLASIDGVPVTRAMVRERAGEDGERTFYYTREYVLTATDELPAGNVVTRGRWGAASTGPRISVEEVMARRIGIDVGSRLTFDVQGVPVEAEVGSLRRVDWQSLTTNFFVIFSAGALDGAPTTFVGTVRAPAAAERAVQDAVARAFPNVTAIPVRDVLERVSAVLDHIGLAIRLVALFTVATGVVVMAGALTATRYQRLYESVVLRTLGAPRATVARAFAVEYGCLGAAAGVGGTALAAVLAWAILTFALDTPWRFDARPLALGVGATIALSVGVGFLATFRLLGAKPLPVLRNE